MHNLFDCPGDPNCNLCHGLGMTRDDLNTKQCVCAFLKKVKHRLGGEISTSKPVIYKSPLFEPIGDGKTSVDLTGENLFIKCMWDEFKPHFRLIATHFLEKFSFCWFWKIVTDENIKTVFLGNEAYSSKSRKKRDEVDTFNSLSDFIGNDYDLIVIRLGFLGYKNVAMSGALKESLLIRQAINKPTWIIEEPNNPFQQGHFSWSQDLSEYINYYFKVINLSEGKTSENTYKCNPEAQIVSSAGLSVECDFDVPISVIDDPVLAKKSKKYKNRSSL